jgi:hypothetical protein
VSDETEPRYFVEDTTAWGTVIRDRKRVKTSYAVARGEKPRQSAAIIAAFVEKAYVSRITDALNDDERRAR